MLVSLVKMLEQGGWLPRWPAGNGYSNSMLGTPADIVIADSYLKGIRDFDVEKAYQAMRRTALATSINLGAQIRVRAHKSRCPALALHRQECSRRALRGCRKEV